MSFLWRNKKRKWVLEAKAIDTEKKGKKEEAIKGKNNVPLFRMLHLETKSCIILLPRKLDRCFPLMKHKNIMKIKSMQEFIIWKSFSPKCFNTPLSSFYISVSITCTKNQKNKKKSTPDIVLEFYLNLLRC